MPCRDDGYREEETANLRQKLDKVTALLCEVLDKMPEKQLIQQSTALKGWWIKHQKDDRARLAREAQEKAAKERYEREHGIDLMATYLYNKKMEIPGFFCIGKGAKSAFLYIDKKSNLPRATAWVQENVIAEKLMFVDIVVSGKPVPLRK